MKKVTIYWVFLRANLYGPKAGYVEYMELEAEDYGQYYDLTQRVRGRRIEKINMIKTHVAPERILIDAYFTEQDGKRAIGIILAKLQDELFEANKPFDIMFWMGGISYARAKYEDSLGVDRGDYYTIGNYTPEVNEKVDLGLVEKSVGGIVFDSLYQAIDYVDKYQPSYSLYKLLNCTESDIERIKGGAKLTKALFIQRIR